jgi:hypothetical protein
VVFGLMWLPLYQRRLRFEAPKLYFHAVRELFSVSVAITG